MENNKLLKWYKNRIKELEKNIELGRKSLQECHENGNILQAIAGNIKDNELLLSELHYAYSIAKYYFATN